MSTENLPEEGEEYRVSLIEFGGESVDISTYWISLHQFALLKAALGDPDVESFYPRDYIDEQGNDAVERGVHLYSEEDPDE